MRNDRPLMLLRARPKVEARERFDAWFSTSHLRDVGTIPGIVEVQAGRTAEGTRLGFYSFESSAVVQQALASAEAAYARGTWEQWTPHLEELLIEIYAPLFPLPIYQSMS